MPENNQADSEKCGVGKTAGDTTSGSGADTIGIVSAVVLG